MKKQLLLENTLKNLFILGGLIIFYFPLHSFLTSLQPANYDSIVFVSTLLIMAFLFADYAFTFTASDLRRPTERLLDYTITTLIMFGTGALLQMSLLAINLRLMKNFVLLDFVAILFYISLVLYDFWDLNRALKNFSK